MNIDQLNTPCLVLNEEKLSNNIERIRNRLDEKALIFRPHMKTAKCIEVGRRMMKSPQGPIAVSTLKEAEKFAEAGVLDILYAVGIAPSKLEAVSALRSRGIDLSIVIDSVSQAEAVAARARLDRDPIPVLIEIDADGSRGGVRFDASEKVLTIARELHAGGAELRGVLTYSGATYECRDVDEIRAVAERERQAAVHSAGTSAERRFPLPHRQRRLDADRQLLGKLCRHHRSAGRSFRLFRSCHGGARCLFGRRHCLERARERHWSLA